jgi:peroxiredoxin
VDATDLTTPEDIDESFVARGVAAEQVALGDELVLVGGSSNATVLNPTGALIWACFDGASTLGELIDDFSAELGVAREVVEADVLGFAQTLGQAGLLEGVGYPPLEMDRDQELPAWEPPTSVDVGGELEDFTLTDLDGAEHRLSDFRGREVLLVNWSPTCGYCTMIADRLGAWQGPLAERDVELVFVTRGDADANRAVFDAAGLEATALALEDGVDPFSGFGTPAAYHLDSRGRVAEQLAVGAYDVPVVAATLAGVDPDGDVATAPVVVDDDDAEPVPEGTRYLAVGGGTCGPSQGSGAKSTGSSTDWAGTRAYRLGDYHVGVRYNSEHTADTLDALFDARVRDPRAQDSYAVALYDDADGGARTLNLLVQGSQQLVRSRSAARVLRALLWRLAEDVGAVDLGTGRLRVSATAAVRRDDALLLPPGLYQWAKQLQPRFARIDIALADVPYAEVDLSTGELVVPEPAIAHRADVLARLDDDVRLGSEPPPVLPGRYPLTTWFIGRPTDEPTELTPAVATVAVLPVVFGNDDVRGRVEQLGELFSRVRAVGISYGSEAALVDAVASSFA